MNSSLEQEIDKVISKAPCLVNTDIYHNEKCKRESVICPYQVLINNNYQCDLVDAIKTTVFNYNKDVIKSTYK